MKIEGMRRIPKAEEDEAKTMHVPEGENSWGRFAVHRNEKKEDRMNDGDDVHAGSLAGGGGVVGRPRSC
jgi:hypothetical protein